LIRITYRFKNKERVFEPDTTQVIIGRPMPGTSVDLDLTGDDTVSRPHARLWFEDGKCWIEDLGSHRGTQVSGEEIKGKGKRDVRPGDVINIGQTTLHVQIPGLQPDLPPVPAPEPPAEEPPVGISQTLDASVSMSSQVASVGTDASKRLALLLDLSLEFGGEGRLEKLLEKIVERLVEIIPGAKRGALLVKDPKTGNLLLKAHLPAGEPSVSMTLARRAMGQRQGFIWQRPSEGLTASVLQHNIISGMYVPLVWNGEALGVACVDNSQTSSGAFGVEDLQFMTAVAQHAAMAVATQRLQEDLRQNSTLLERLLTSFSPKIRARLLERARHGQLNPGGKKSEVTILLSDIRGYTLLTEKMEAEDVLDMLNEYFPALIEPIFRHDGSIDKFIGDAILAVFGSPEPDPSQHQNAVKAALEMQAAVSEINKARAKRGMVTCQIGVGIHTGEVLHGFVGSRERMEFTVVGSAVNLAARYCSAAAAGEVLISREVHGRVFQLIDAEYRKITTKHQEEGELDAYRVKRLK
jgi:adenylate cyclase